MAGTIIGVLALVGGFYLLIDTFNNAEKIPEGEGLLRIVAGVGMMMAGSVAVLFTNGFFHLPT